MIRIHVPGLSGLALRVCATTNNVVWHHGVVDVGTQSIETQDGEVIPRSQVRWVRHDGAGTWVNPQEARAAILVLALIAGMPHDKVMELAREGTEPERRDTVLVGN